ncbi:MAG: hypothetical protein NDI63_14030 [Pseudobdellovibrio sp.]|nr:hypothetical protein [Pseudobdellovibrio sp.]
MSKTNNTPTQETEHIHFRRCHVCGTMNERANSLVDRCDSCNKALAPFVFFDEQRALGVSDETPKEEPSKRASTIKITRLATETIYPPIWGLTVYW